MATASQPFNDWGCLGSEQELFTKDTITMALPMKKAREIIRNLIGDEAVRIMDFLGSKKNMSEFSIAEHCKLDMQTIRHLLYRMNGLNIASYIRKKDREKGWYISYWTFNLSKVGELLSKMQREQLAKLRERLEREEDGQGNFFICPKGCVRVDFDQAVELTYHCPECGSLLTQQDNVKTIENIRDRIKELQKGIKVAS